MKHKGVTKYIIKKLKDNNKNKSKKKKSEKDNNKVVFSCYIRNIISKTLASYYFVSDKSYRVSKTLTFCCLSVNGRTQSPIQQPD